jgi:hypothetical protein
MEKFSSGQYRDEVSNRFAASENLDAEVDTTRSSASETVNENFKMSTKRLE